MAPPRMSRHRQTRRRRPQPQFLLAFPPRLIRNHRQAHPTTRMHTEQTDRHLTTREHTPPQTVPPPGRLLRLLRPQHPGGNDASNGELTTSRPHMHPGPGFVLSTTSGPTPAHRNERSNHKTSCFYRYRVNLRVQLLPRLLLQLFIYLSTPSIYNNLFEFNSLTIRWGFPYQLFSDSSVPSSDCAISGHALARISGHAHRPMYLLGNFDGFSGPP